MSGQSFADQIRQVYADQRRELAEIKRRERQLNRVKTELQAEKGEVLRGLISTEKIMETYGIQAKKINYVKGSD